MGVVYLAHDTVLERDVALKVMVAGIANEPELKQRFEREARAVAKMTHPSIVTVFDLGSHTDGSPFIAMELLKGQDLAHAMRQGPMALDRIVAIIARVLAGLNCAHQAAVVHRDIKPANIFLNADGSVKIMDFGVARLTTASMTGTGNIVGTADYMSPEQVQGAKVDGRSDLFSVGSLFYELLTGRRPFHAENLMAIFYRITHEEPDFDLIPDGEAYEPLIPILRKALAKDLNQRYRTAYEFMADLREYLRLYATTASAQQALEGLLDIEAPPTPPPPLTDGGTHPAAPAEPTEILAGTVDGELTVPAARGAAGRPASTAPTRRARPTTTPTVLAQPRQAVRPALPAPRAGVIGYVLAGVALAVLAGGGVFFYFYLSRRAPSPPTLATATPVITPVPATPEPTPLPAPPTPAPEPTFAPTRGRGEAAMRAAQTAFARGDYDTALAQAQKALAEQPDQADARKLVDSALKGQSASSRFRTAEAALARGDFSQASSEAEAGRVLAPWDARGTELLGRVREGQERAQAQLQQQQQAQTAGRIASLLNRADEALSAQKYDAALNLYDEVLKLDSQNARASLGKTGAITARATAQAAAQAAAAPQHVAPPGKSFVSGKTSAQSAETSPVGSIPTGFEDSPKVAARRGTQAAQLPGKIVFEVRPDPVRPGERYSVTVFFNNEGGASIPLKDMFVTTTVNGKKAGGGQVPLSVAEVAPRQKAVLLSQPDNIWREEFTSWSMEVIVHTARGETYRNQATWR
jgi:eukaryotic-like serine/threonine-protein kinase